MNENKMLKWYGRECEISVTTMKCIDNQMNESTYMKNSSAGALSAKVQDISIAMLIHVGLQ